MVMGYPYRGHGMASFAAQAIRKGAWIFSV
jgi:hypothetical protein